jgi:hypothetical protein
MHVLRKNYYINFKFIKQFQRRDLLNSFHPNCWDYPPWCSWVVSCEGGVFRAALVAGHRPHNHLPQDLCFSYSYHCPEEHGHTQQSSGQSWHVNRH